MTGRHKWGLTLKQAGWKEPHGSTRRELNQEKKTEKESHCCEMLTDWVSLSGTSQYLAPSPNVWTSVPVVHTSWPWANYGAVKWSFINTDRFLIHNFTCIPMIIIVNVLSCKGPSTLITKFISVKLLTRVDFLSSPTPSSTVTNLRRLNTDNISFPNGWRSDILNTL